MKIVWGNVSEQHAHVIRQIAIDRGAQFLRSNLALQLSASHLSFSVHAGIGAARARNDDFPSVQQRKHARQLALHGAQLSLRLPAVKVRAVVLEEQFEVHKSEGSRQKAEGREHPARTDAANGLRSAYCLLPTAVPLPGFVAGPPCLHNSQTEESTAAT